jgi:hypothetical protein
MRRFSPVLVAAALAGCRPPASPAAAPALVEPAVFATWPRVTERPVRVSARLAALCAALPAGAAVARDTAARAHDPHAEYAIVVRVSPHAAAAYREGRPLPAGAVVVKEKYADAAALGPMQAYALMTRRAAGFDPRGGDWEYAYVALGAEPRVTRGRLAECAGCHASARGTDFLFRSYGGPGR